MHANSFVFFLLFSLFSVDLLPAQQGALDAHNSVPYLQRRANFKTKLIKRGPAPKDFVAAKPPVGAHEIFYPSGKLKLKAWVQSPPVRRGAKLPAVVFFHGEFAFTANDFKNCKPFLDAGFVVMAPMLRGENGNPGDCEMFLGEVDDAVAAVNWLAKQRVVDPRRIYTFGHSAGGVISAMLSLMDNVPIAHGGSSGGLYNTALFTQIKSRVPFDLTDPLEGRLRVLPGNTRWMKRNHYAFIGTEDTGIRFGVWYAEREIKEQANAKLKIIKHPGAHNSALGPAIKQYIQLIKDES